MLLAKYNPISLYLAYNQSWYIKSCILYTMLSYTMSKNLVPQSKPSSMFFIFILMTHFSKVMIIFFFNFWKRNIVYKILLITGWPGLYVDLADSASYIFYSILALFTCKMWTTITQHRHLIGISLSFCMQVGYRL